MNVLPPDPKELSALLRLLDDDTPEVRSGVSGKLAQYGGDLSEMLPEAAPLLGDSEKVILGELLRPARRRALREEWLAPTFGSAALGDDWELFESQLRLLSDFLHDGVSLRQPLSDALDLLAEEAKDADCLDANDLRAWMFEDGRMKPNAKNYYDPRNADLAWCISEGYSNPIGLGMVYMLVARRLEYEVEGISFPGHFLCRIFEDGFPLVIDCYDKGRVHAQKILVDSSNELSDGQRFALEQSADLGTILMRLLNNLRDAFIKLEQHEDAALIEDVRKSMSGTD